MLALTLSRGFAPSEDALAAPALAEGVFGALGAALRGGPFTVAADAKAGREAALTCCRERRLERRVECVASFNRATTAAAEVDRRLSSLIAVPSPG